MSSQKFEVTNPEAIKLINDIKSGAVLAPLKYKIAKYKWVIVGSLTLIALFVAITVGKQLSARNTPKYLPPIIDDITITPTPEIKSSFDGLRKLIIDYSATLPEPALPAVDNQISLESKTN